MKIGILTFHCAHNYGAVLQAYATQECLRGMGHEVEIIDYRPKYLLTPFDYSLSFKRPYKNILRRILSYFKMLVSWICVLVPRFQRRKGFDDFINSKLLLSSERYYDPFCENLNYDCFIIGSDQVWNPEITKVLDSVYFGNFVTSKNSKKISYAASMSLYSLSKEQTNELKCNLRNFVLISVREQELSNYIYEHFNIYTQVVLDPTLLVDNYIWRKIAILPNITKKYVLLYTLGLQNESRRIAKRIAKQLDGVVVELTDKPNFIDSNYSFSTASPEMFVGFFQNASFVVTSSFHGTAFAISYQKPFYSIARGNDKDSRQYSLLRNLDLCDRFIDKDSSPEYLDVNYLRVFPKWRALQEKSLCFLTQALNHIFP